MRISDWSSDVCSSDLTDAEPGCERRFLRRTRRAARPEVRRPVLKIVEAEFGAGHAAAKRQGQPVGGLPVDLPEGGQLCILGAVVAGVKYAVGQHASGCEEQVDWHSEHETQNGKRNNAVSGKRVS